MEEQNYYCPHCFGLLKSNDPETQTNKLYLCLVNTGVTDSIGTLVDIPVCIYKAIKTATGFIAPPGYQYIWHQPATPIKIDRED